MSGIECPVCTNVPGLGAGNCDSGKVPKVTCADGLNQCMSLKGKMTVLSFTQSIELKNCSNNVLCGTASDYNGKNSKESPPPPPSSTLRRRLAYDHKRMLGVSLWRINSDFRLGYSFKDVNAIFLPIQSKYRVIYKINTHTKQIKMPLCCTEDTSINFNIFLTIN